MPVQSIRMRFLDAPYGWEEEFFTQEVSTEKALRKCNDLAALRFPLTGTTTHLEEIQASDEAVLGDSMVEDDGNFNGRHYQVEADDPWIGLQVYLAAQIGAGANAFFYHRVYPIRGIPKTQTAIAGDLVNGYTLKGDYLADFNAFKATLTNGSYYLRVTDKSQAAHAVTDALAVVGQPALTDFVIKNHGLTIGKTCILRKMPDPWKFANGRHKVIHVNGNIVRLAVKWIVDPLPLGGEEYPVVTNYAAITDAVFTGIMKRATGRTKQASKGQKKRRPTPTP